MIQLITEITKAPIIAAQNDSTEKPVIMVATNQKNTPLRTTENKPKVNRLIGKVKIFITGFITKLIKTKQADTTKAVVIVLTRIPATK